MRQRIPAPRRGGSKGWKPPGRRLATPRRLRRPIQRSLGPQFADVPIYADRDQARRLGTSAFAIGGRVGVDDSQVNPSTPWGRQVIAHELIHVAQAHRGVGEAPRSKRTDAAELEAEALVPRVLTGAPVRVRQTAAARAQAAPPKEVKAVELDPAVAQALPPSIATAIVGQLTHLLDPTRAEPLAGEISERDTYHLHITLPPLAGAAEPFAAKRAALVESADAFGPRFRELRSSSGQDVADQALREELRAAGGLGERMRAFFDAVLAIPGAGITYHTFEEVPVPGSTAKRGTDPRRHHFFEATATEPTPWPLESEGVIKEEPGGFPPGLRGNVQFDFWLASDGKLMLVPTNVSQLPRDF